MYSDSHSSDKGWHKIRPYS